jgi:hypothetical protein
MPSMILYLPISFVFALEREFALAPGMLSNQLKIVLAGELTSFLFLHISSLTLLRNRKVKHQNLFLCIFVWAFTGVIRGFFAEFYATSLLNLDSHASLRILVSVMFSTLGLGFAAYSFGSIYELETKKAALRSLNGFISSENIGLNSEQVAMKEEAIITLQQTLIPKVIQLQRLTAGLKKYELSQPLALALFSLEEQAHRLVYQMRVNLDNLESIPNPRSGVASRIFNSSQITLKLWPNVISVKLSFFFLSIGGVVVQFGRNTTTGALCSLLGSVISVVTLLIFDRISRRDAISRKSFIVTCAYVSIFLLQYLYSSRLVPQLFDLAQPFDPWYPAVKVTFAVYLASLYLSFLKADSLLLQSMSTESMSSREILDLKSSKNEMLDAVNTTTNQGELQGHISGVIMALNLLTKDEDTFLSNRDPSGIINNANLLLSNAIAEIQNLSVKDLLN